MKQGLTNTKRKNFDIIDLTKLILAIMVVCIHTSLWPKILFPYFRIAVPIFFIISSYFFFRKICTVTESSVQQSFLKKYVLRNCKLYLFYLIVLMPITWFKRGWFKEGFLHGIWLFFRSLFLGSTFMASWFIMASILGITIVYFLSRKLSNRGLLTIGSITYIGCCFSSNYYELFHSVPLLGNFMDKFELVFSFPYNNVFVSLFWIIIGKLFAEGKINLKPRPAWVMLFVSLLLLTAEHYLINLFFIPRANDCYLMLAPVSISIFALLLQTEGVQLRHTKYMRKFSTMIYAVHGSLLPVGKAILNHTPFGTQELLLFLLVMIMSVIYGFVIIRLEKVRGLGWLQYAY